MDLDTLYLVGAIVAAFLVGGVTALRSVAPLTENKIDDKALELGEKSMPVLVKVLEFFRARAAK
jgi:hypothetical protein